MGSRRLPPLPIRGFRPSGPLRERMHLNFDRMDSPRYAPLEKTGCLQRPDYAWPGDMEGRSLLAFVLLARASGRPAAHLAGLRAQWPGRLNGSGYFGPLLDPQAINEQQLSGHGWVLRGLCELYDWQRDPGILNEIRTIVANLALPTRGAHAVYPIDPAERVRNRGGHVGEVVQATGRWVLSTDVGCDLIFMDGLMHAATLLNDPPVDALCEEILARNLRIDLLAIQAQTHATLTGVRGMLRWAVHKRRPSLVAEAEARFRLYVTEGITENYENWNWFGRPTHTEPCAVVDSLIVAHELWRLTGNAEYLAWAHRILYNGFFNGQVANGGFGCSTVAGANGARRVGVSEAAHEAWWCCSMRAAEGFAELARRACYARGADLFITGLSAGRLDTPLGDGRLTAAATGGYPVEGRWTLTVEEPPPRPVRLHVFAPPWGTRPVLVRNGKQVPATLLDGFLTARLTLRSGDVLAYAFAQRVHARSAVNIHTPAGLVTYNYGPLVLALAPGAPPARRLPPPLRWRWDASAGAAAAPGFGGLLSPLGERFRLANHDPRADSRQILFAGR
jgi:uncharacterized protein